VNGYKKQQSGFVSGAPGENRRELLPDNNRGAKHSFTCCQGEESRFSPLIIPHRDCPAGNAGFVLVMALLYLFVVTLLVAGTFGSGILQTKMDNSFSSAEAALQNAESALVVGKLAIHGNEQQGHGNAGVNAAYSYVKQPDTDCGVAYYLLQSEGTDVTAHAKKSLEELVAVPIEDKNCPAGAVLRQRVYWREIQY